MVGFGAKCQVLDRVNELAEPSEKHNNQTIWLQNNKITAENVNTKHNYTWSHIA